MKEAARLVSEKPINIPGLFSFIFGCVSFLFLFILPFVMVPFSLAGLVFGIVSWRQQAREPGRHEHHWMGISGIIVNLILALLGITVTIFLLVVLWKANREIGGVSGSGSSGEK